MTRYNDRTDKPAPFGAIVKRQEIVDLVIEARKEKKAIRVWTVEQSGYLSAFYITSKSRLHKPTESLPGPAFFKVDCFKDHSIIGYKTTNKRWFKTDQLLGSFNIESYGGNCHYAFTSKKAAVRYSEELKADKAYMDGVKAWHQRCSNLFNSYSF